MKRGYVFTVDLTIALIILFIGLAIIFYRAPTLEDSSFVTTQLSQDVIGVMAATKVSSLCADVGTPSCACPSYPKIQDVCTTQIHNKDGSLLSMLSELIYSGSVSGDQVKGVVHEIFVQKQVIDVNRFGFALLYKDAVMAEPLTLYNSEVDG